MYLPLLGKAVQRLEYVHKQVSENPRLVGSVYGRPTHTNCPPPPPPPPAVFLVLLALALTPNSTHIYTPQPILFYKVLHRPRPPRAPGLRPARPAEQPRAPPPLPLAPPPALGPHGHDGAGGGGGRGRRGRLRGGAHGAFFVAMLRGLWMDGWVGARWHDACGCCSFRLVLPPL